MEKGKKEIEKEDKIIEVDLAFDLLFALKKFLYH